MPDQNTVKFPGASGDEKSARLYTLFRDPDPVAIEMTRDRLQLLIQQYRNEITRPSLASAGPWFALLLTTFPLAISNDFHSSKLLSSDHWQNLLFAVSLVSAGMIVRTVLSSVGIAARRIIPEFVLRLLPEIGHPTDAVPVSPAQFASLILAQYQPHPTGSESPGEGKTQNDG